MTTPYPVPPRFFTLPDGTQSSIQIKFDSDGFKVPVAITTPAQLLEWNQIQDAAPPTQHEAATAMMKAAIRPLFGEDAEADNASGISLLEDLRAVAAASDAVSVTTEMNMPRTQAEYNQRANAAAAVAACLGMQLVSVGDDAVMKVPAHLELRQGANPFMAGNLVTLEAALRDLARERAKRDQQIRLWREHQERIERERQEAIAALPENRLARLEAKLAAAGIDVGV